MAAPTPDEMQERLDRLQEGIDAARRRAKEDKLLPKDPDEREPSLADPNPQDPSTDDIPGHATG